MDTPIIQEQQIPTAKGIPGSTLKIIAIIAMFIDHFAAILVSGYLMLDYNSSMTNDEMAAWSMQHAGVNILMLIMRLIGRFGFPIFCFLLIEGFNYTKHMKKYIRNLTLFALISELPFNLGFSGTLFYPGYQNVFFTLLLGLLTLLCIRTFAEEKAWSEKLSPLCYIGGFLAGGLAMYLLNSCELFIIISQLGLNLTFLPMVLGGGIIGVIIVAIIGHKWTPAKKTSFFFYLLPITAGVVIANLLKTDYAGWGVFTIVVMYLFRRNKNKEMGLGCLALTIMSSMEITSFLMMIPVSKYNGKRGLSLKYFFYAFYPVHILLIYLLSYALGFSTFAIR